MKQIIKRFLESGLIEEQLNEEFDYTFNENSSIKAFDIEFKKFLRYYNSVLYSKNRLISILNNNEIRLNLEELEFIFKLYQYVEKSKSLYYKYIIEDFLYTYNITINTIDYKEKCKKHRESKNDFNSILVRLNISEKFHNTFPKDLYKFYKKIIIYGLKNNIYIDRDLIAKMFNNLKASKIDYDELIDLFISNKKYLYNIIVYDRKIKSHINTYIFYIKESLESFGGYNYVKKIIFTLEKAGCLDQETNNLIINLYIKALNELVNKLKKKGFSFAEGIGKIETLREELLFFLKNIKSYDDTQFNKIKECLSRLLRIKRYIISDENYVKSEMQEIVYKQEIPKNECKNFRNALLKNKYRLYSASKIQFSSVVKNAIDMYSSYAISSIIPRYEINSKRETYTLDSKTNKKKAVNNFKIYYDMLGKKYIDSHQNLLNKLQNDYYEEMLKHLSKTFYLHQSLLISMISKEDFKNIIDNLKKEINYNFDNEYAVVVSNVLAIETNVIKLLRKNNMSISKDGFENLNNLFELYNGNIENADGLMYINYILYEKSGVNLRNNIMHGTLINENLTMPLMVSFSCLIFISWLLHEW